jgi:hypothetical protein
MNTHNKFNRVIPRDLFNEAKLLKCLGNIYIQAEYQPPGTVEIHFFDHTDKGFDVCQNPADGMLYSNNISVRVHGLFVHVMTNYNSKDPWPLYAYITLDASEPIQVFNGEGIFTDEFLAIGAKPQEES